MDNMDRAVKTWRDDVRTAMTTQERYETPALDTSRTLGCIYAHYVRLSGLGGLNDEIQSCKHRQFRR